MKNNSKISELIYKSLKNPELLKELKKNPKKVIEKELNTKLPENYQLEVLEETPEKGYLVIPSNEMTKKLSDEELKAMSAAGTVSLCAATCVGFGCQG